MAEIVVVGAGVIGSSVAMHLAERGAKVRVLDWDLEGTWSSSELNAGGVRATWNQSINIEMARDSIEYFASVASEVGYRACGYLWLHRAEGMKRALEARERQQTLGWEVEAWDVATLRRRVPFIDKTDDLVGAVFGVRDGLVNPNLLKNHFRARARRAGAVFQDRTLVVGYAGGTLQCVGSVVDPQTLRPALGTHDSTKVSTLSAERVINCAGPWAGVVARALGYEVPTVPVRRQISIFDARGVDLTPYGMIVDASGVYFHPEAANGLAGFAHPHEPTGMNFEYEGDAFFQEWIWPSLYERSSAFEELKHLTGWAGLYEVSPDETAIVGRAKEGIYEARSFSGHGVMHSYAAGRALAELITTGRYETLDLAPLSSRRFATGHPIRETLVI